MKLPFIGDLIKTGADLIKSYFPPDLTPEQRSQLEAGLREFQIQQQQVQMQAWVEGQKYFQTDNALIRSVRPVLTYGIALLYNGAMVGGLMFGKVDFAQYMAAMGPVNAMLMGFWFGERSALKDPKRKTPLEDENNQKVSIGMEG